MAVTKTKTKTEKIIEDITYSSSNQSISRRLIYEFKNLKVMLELKSDSYRGQCYARASVLDNLEWRVIYFIPYAEMRTPAGLCHYPTYINNNAPNAKREFDKDIERLKKYISELL